MLENYVATINDIKAFDPRYQIVSMDRSEGVLGYRTNIRIAVSTVVTAKDHQNLEHMLLARRNHEVLTYIEWLDIFGDLREQDIQAIGLLFIHGPLVDSDLPPDVMDNLEKLKLANRMYGANHLTVFGVALAIGFPLDKISHLTIDQWDCKQSKIRRIK